jgi:hypothetical protein
MDVMSMEDLFGEVISTYTRAQALEDGVLVDVDALSPTMRDELGFKFPIALTIRLFEEVVKPDAKAEENGQSIEGRLWDALWMLLNAIRLQRPTIVNSGRHVEVPTSNPNNRPTLRADGMGVKTYRAPGPCQTTEYRCGFTMNGRQKELTLKAICGPGDNMEPVITIMLPDED